MSGEAVAAHPEGLLDGGAWFRVEEASAAASVRRSAERLAAGLGLSERRVADLAIVVAEVAGNLVKHADQGFMHLRAVRTEAEAGVELISVDSGPGMADVTRALSDGHSTAGTLGIGLGAVVRQTTWMDLHSVPGKGTVLAAQVWPAERPQSSWAAGLIRPITGETVSGDGFAVRDVDGRLLLMMCDGLGHGPLAARVAQEATRVFGLLAPMPLTGTLEALHRALGHTRGAALAVAELEADCTRVRYAGLGNISGTIVSGDGSRRGLVSLPGIVGHQKRQIREYEYPFPPGAVLVMHSDGLVERWKPADVPGLFTHSPQVIAATLLRDAGTRRDDAGVLVARCP